MKQLVVEKNNPEPILWETPIPRPGPGEVLIQNHYLEKLSYLPEFVGYQTMEVLRDLSYCVSHISMVSFSFET